MIGIVLGCIAIVVTVTSIWMLINHHKYRIRVSETLNISKNSTHYLDDNESDRSCDICLGVVGDAKIATCSCGKIFHNSCAEPTGLCPYCGAPYACMKISKPTHSICPLCKNAVVKNTCSCGAVYPRIDDTFLCECGERLDCRNPKCNKCGAVYEKIAVPIKTAKLKTSEHMG